MLLIIGSIVVLSKAVLSLDQYPDGVHLINRLDEFFHFDLHHYLVDSTVDLSRWLPTSSSNTELVNFKQRTVHTSNDISMRKVLIDNANKNRFMIVVVDWLIYMDTSYHVTALHKVVNMKIGLFIVQEITSLADVKSLLNSIWEDGRIFNIFCAFYLNNGDGNSSSFNVFKFNPFITFRLINVTGTESVQDYFTDKVPNHCGTRFRSYVVGSSLDVIEAQFWPILLSVFNATMTDMKRTGIMSPNIDKIDEDLFNYAHTDLRITDEYPVYPHGQTVRVLIVPHAQPYTDFVAYIKNGTWTQIFVFTSIVIVMSSLLLTVSRYLQRGKKILPLECVVDVLNLLMNDNAGIKYGNLRWADISIIVPLTFTGLIVMNGIVSLFQSYLTSPIYQRQIDSIEDLYTSSVPILSMGYTNHFYVRIMENMTNYGGWNDKVHAVSKLRNIIETFNNSIAFFVREELARSLIKVQKRLGLEVYHVVKDATFAKYVISYHMYPAFPFMAQMTDVILRLNDGGLFDKWTKDEVELKTQDLWIRKLSAQSDSGDELEADDFSVPTIVWCGWIASVIVFVCELIWNGLSRIKFTRSDRRTRKSSENSTFCTKQRIVDFFNTSLKFSWLRKYKQRFVYRPTGIDKHPNKSINRFDEHQITT